VGGLWALKFKVGVAVNCARFMGVRVGVDLFFRSIDRYSFFLINR